MLSILAMLVSSAVALDCGSFDQASTDEGNEYLQEIDENPVLETNYKESLIRKSVSAFYGDDYKSSMSIEGVEEMAEGVGVTKVKDPRGKEWIEVNVGFGGGNSISYYYKVGTLKWAPITITDGADCAYEGSMEAHPFDSKPQSPKVLGLSCKNTSESALITAVTATLNTSKGNLTDTKTKLNVSLSGLAPVAKEDTISVSQTRSGNIFRLGFREQRQRDGLADLILEHTIVIKDGTGKVKTTSYEAVVGGRWKDPKTTTSEMACETPKIKDIRYQRKVQY